MKKQELGQYFTVKNPFTYKEFNDWLSLVPDCKVLEPFVGGWDIPRHLGIEFDGYDIEPTTNTTIQQDTIKHFPKGYKVCITNPPYLAKNSAKRKKLAFPEECKHDDVYKYCLELMLDNCEYVAVIIPETFIMSNFPKHRLISVISFEEDKFEDTSVPTCLALFGPEKTNDFNLYFGDKLIGKYNEINYIEDWKRSREWSFNEVYNQIGLCAIDKGGATNDIKFCLGSELDIKNKNTNRYYVNVGNKHKVFNNDELLEIVSEANKVLNKLRLDTDDFVLSPFKNRRKDGTYRRRMSFSLANKILTKVCTI